MFTIMILIPIIIESRL